jgi:hypothetical protein
VKFDDGNWYCGQVTRTHAHKGLHIRFDDGDESWEVWPSKDGAVKLEPKLKHTKARAKARPGAKIEGENQQQQNQENNRHAASSSYRGVTWHKSSASYTARIRYGGSQKHIGSFQTALQAAKAYDVAARKHHGRSSSPNFPTKAEATRQLQSCRAVC